MGFDQYWLSAPALPPGAWDRMAGDFARVAAALHRAGLRLAGPDGTGLPVLNGETIAFNGVRDCGHGQGRRTRRAAAAIPTGCEGTCAGGPFALRRSMPDDEYTKVYGTESPITVDGVRTGLPRVWTGKYFSKCRTCRRPYDLAVCCALIAAKRRFGSLVVVSSDGTNEDWAAARGICQSVLGYGGDMTMSKSTGRMRCAAGARTPRAPRMRGRHVPVYSPDGDGLDLVTAGIGLSMSGSGRPSLVALAAVSGEDDAGGNSERRRPRRQRRRRQ